MVVKGAKVKKKRGGGGGGRGRGMGRCKGRKAEDYSRYKVSLHQNLHYEFFIKGMRLVCANIQQVIYLIEVPPPPLPPPCLSRPK